MNDIDELDSKQAKRREKFNKLIEEDVNALIATMSHREGRRTLWRILRTTGWDEASFTGNSETFKREGMRAVGLLLRAELRCHCPILYQLMLNENDNGVTNA